MEYLRDTKVRERGKRMGLDMYLSETKYVSHYPGLADAYESYAKELVTSEAIIEATGSVNPIFEDGGSVTVQHVVAYWRKAHAIHGWFVRNVQGGKDDCEEYEVTFKDLQTLLKDCKEALETNDTSALPATDGFFFGVNRDDPYDEWYWNNIRNTIEMVGKIVETTERARQESENPEYAPCYFAYHASW